MQQPVPQTPAPLPGSAPPLNSLAVVSLAAGAASFVILPVVGALVAVITGHMARAQIRQTGESGGGMAMAGLVLGYVHLALAALALLVVVLVLLGLGAFLVHQAH